MAVFNLTSYNDSYASNWDKFCENSQNATFLHFRRFLSYHGDRFFDESLLIWKDHSLVGVFPAARSGHCYDQVVSHPGATFGGLIHAGRLGGLKAIEVLKLIGRYYKDRGYSELIYKVVPYIYHRVPSQDDLYALFILGAQRLRCDLSSCINLSCRREISDRRRRSLKKAKSVVTISYGFTYLSDFWFVLNENLWRRHGVRAVHSLEEIRELTARFPNNIKLIVALIEDSVVAGSLFFNSPNVWHAQYIASNELGMEVSAIDAVFDFSIELATKEGVRFFDFGTSNENEGRYLNEGLYTFKSEFGGGGVVYEQYSLDLNSL